MTVELMEKWLKEKEGYTLTGLQRAVLKRVFKNTNRLHIPIVSSKENIVESCKDRDFYIIHTSGTIDKQFNEDELVFFGIMFCNDSDNTYIVAFP